MYIKRDFSIHSLSLSFSLVESATIFALQFVRTIRDVYVYFQSVEIRRALFKPLNR